MVEAEGASLVNLLLEAMREASQGGDTELVVRALEQTRDTLPGMSALIKLLHQHCRADYFYSQIRPFFPGAKGKEALMPDGVVLYRSDGTYVGAKCVGGSAAQSSYFQFLDLALGVKHKPLGKEGGETVFEVSKFGFS
jgi:indoleamine 2,3-dioxygenase